MLKIICCVRDIAADVYANPFASQNAQTALRDFGHACRDENSQLCKNPEDFQLFQVAIFDDSIGVITGHEPKLIANATQFAKGE